MSILEIQNLSKTFKNGKKVTPVLDAISMNIEKGDIYGVIGLSGEGKSTLVRCINRLEQADSGHIYFIDECNTPEIYCLYGNAMRGKTPHEYKTVKDVLVHNGGEWWKTDSKNTEVFSVVDFKEGSSLDILLEGLFPNKCKYEK